MKSWEKEVIMRLMLIQVFGGAVHIRIKELIVEEW